MAADPFDLNIKAEREWSSSTVEKNWSSLGSLRKQFNSPSISPSSLNYVANAVIAPKTPFTVGANLFLGYKHTIPPSVSIVSSENSKNEPPSIFPTNSNTVPEDAANNYTRPPLYNNNSDQRNSISKIPPSSIQLDTNNTLITDKRRRSSSSSSKSRDSKSSITRDSSASTLFGDNMVSLTEAELSSLPLEPQSPQITFYQGFRAVYPELALPMTKSTFDESMLNNNNTTSTKHTLLNESGFVRMKYEKLQVRETMEVQIGTSAATTRTNGIIKEVDSSILVESPQNARKHSVSIQNVSRLFTELLNERDLILDEAARLDSERGSYTDQLRQIENMLTELNRKKGEVIKRLRQVADREENVNQILDDLDVKISSVGDESARFERKIRSIKGDSASFDIDDITKPLSNTCLKTLFGHKDTIECIDFDIPFGTLATGSADRTIRIWDLSSYRCSGVLSGHTGWVRCVQKREQTLMSGSGDHTIRQWDLSLIPPMSPIIKVNASLHQPHEPPAIDSQVICKQVFSGHSGGVGCLAFDEKVMVSGSTDKTIRVWDLKTGEAAQVLRTEKWIEAASMNRVDAMVVGRGARELGLLPPAAADVFTDNPIENGGYMLYNVGGHVATLQFVEFALAAGYGDGVVRLWDLRSAKCHRELGLKVGGHTGAITCLKFNERVIITGGIDKKVNVWDLRVGYILETINFDTGIKDLAFDTWKIVVATSSKDISVYNRNTSSLRILDEGFSSTFSNSNNIMTSYGNQPDPTSSSSNTGNTGHSKSVRCLSLVDDMLCSGGADQVVKVWRMSKKGEPI